MQRQEIIDYFSHTNVHYLHSFRALCNAFKALCIQVAVDVWKRSNKGRISVCDLACGKGGDICKWMQYRPRIFIGIDGSTKCIQEAERRHAKLLSTGQCCMKTMFVCHDICDESQIEVKDASIDIVSSNFFLHFACESQRVLEKVLTDIYRICRPGGIFLAIVPDGDRAMKLLSNDTSSILTYGHFKLRKRTEYDKNITPYGFAYEFSLEDSFCTEYVLLPQLLDSHLRSQGFETVFDNDAYSSPAQNFFQEHLSYNHVLNDILKNKMLSEIDWLSLSFFRVFLARKPS